MQFDMTRAWKDEEYRQSLSQEQQAQLESPAGEMELSETELELVNGTGNGYGVDSVKGYRSAGGVVANSYYCGNFSIRPTTNLGPREDREFRDDEREGALLDLIPIDALNTRVRNRRDNRFDFSCSISGGFGGGICISGGN